MSLDNPQEVTYTVVAMDMDNLERFYIRDGKLMISKLSPVPEETVRKLFLEDFEGEAWKMADEPLPFKLYESILKIRKEHINTSEVNECEALVRRNVLNRSRSQLIVRCFDADWQVALLSSVLDHLKISPIKKGEE
jgi:hypothetical protein